MRRLPTTLLALALASLLASPAFAQGVTVSQEQSRAAQEVNRARAAAGQAPVTSNAALNTAAYRHSRYLGEEGQRGHYETLRHSPYYTAYSPADRAAALGYTGPVSENVGRKSFTATGTRTYLAVDNAIQWWLAAIYHRFSILNPRTVTLGYGPYYTSTRAYSTLDMGTDRTGAGPVVKWPVPNQTGVPTGFQNESPNPVAQWGRECTDESPCGYPVSVTWRQGEVRATSLTLRRADTGAAVYGYRLTPQNDQYHLWSVSLSFIPDRPLDHGVRYTATFAGEHTPVSGGDAIPFSHTWLFTAQHAPGVLLRSSPASYAKGAPRQGPISLAFTQPVRNYTLVATPYSQISYTGVGASLARSSDGTEVAFSFAKPAGETTTTVQLSPSAPLAANTTYRLRYAFADAWGRPQRGTLYFTTGP
jgi:uncharacterized protein YkwD